MVLLGPPRPFRKCNGKLALRTCSSRDVEASVLNCSCGGTVSSTMWGAKGFRAELCPNPNLRHPSSSCVRLLLAYSYCNLLSIYPIPSPSFFFPSSTFSLHPLLRSVISDRQIRRRRRDFCTAAQYHQLSVLNTVTAKPPRNIVI